MQHKQQIIFVRTTIENSTQHSEKILVTKAKFNFSCFILSVSAPIEVEDNWAGSASWVGYIWQLLGTKIVSCDEKSLSYSESHLVRKKFMVCCGNLSCNKKLTSFNRILPQNKRLRYSLEIWLWKKLCLLQMLPKFSGAKRTSKGLRQFCIQFFLYVTHQLF